MTNCFVELLVSFANSRCGVAICAHQGRTNQQLLLTPDENVDQTEAVMRFAAMSSVTSQRVASTFDPATTRRATVFPSGDRSNDWMIGSLTKPIREDTSTLTAGAYRTPVCARLRFG